MLRALVLVCLTAQFLLGAPLQAQRSLGELKSNLEQVRTDIQNEERKLKRVRKRKADLEREQGLLKSELGKIEGEQQSLRLEVDSLATRIARLESVNSRAKEMIALQRESLRTRIQAIYRMYRHSGALHYLLRAKSATEFLRRATLIRRLAEYDKRKLGVLQAVREDFAREAESLRLARQERAQGLERLNALADELVQKQERQQALVSSVQEQETKRLAAREKLQGSAVKLEKLIASLMGGKTRSPKPATTGVPGAAEYSGAGLRAARGTLSLPVDGDVLTAFGKQRHSEFSDVLFKKGWEFRSQSGAEVRAIAAGRVMLAQNLPGYGRVVIVDHGKRYYSLYARLAVSVARVGDILQQGARIGVLGEIDSKGRNFYFEIRFRGKSLDPGPYFKKQPRILKS